MNPYNNKYTFQPLLKEEISIIDKVWKFIDAFRDETLTKSSYIHHIIKKINKTYNITDFLIYETITEKLYWNLCNVIIDKIYVYDTIKENYKINKSQIVHKLLTESIVGKSSMRKAFIYNGRHNSYMYKYNYPNDFDMLIFSIMINRSTYETILSNSEITLDEINDLVKNPYNSIVEFDYPFPNLNTIKPFVNSMKKRMLNIKKLYYSPNSFENWKIEFENN